MSIIATKTLPKYVIPNISLLKKTLSKKVSFPENTSALKILNVVPQIIIFWFNTNFLAKPSKSHWSQHFKTLLLLNNNTFKIVGVICI